GVAQSRREAVPRRVVGGAATHSGIRWGAREGRALAPPGGAFDERDHAIADPEPVLGQERHRPTLTSTATATSSLDVATRAATREGGSVFRRMIRTGLIASGSAARPSSAHGWVMPMAMTAANDPT